MAFIKVNKTMVGAASSSHFRNRVPSLRMASHLQSATMTSRAIAFYFSTPLIEQVGWPVEKQDDDRRRITVSINEGTGEDAGVLMLEHDPKGYVMAVSKATARTYGLAVSAPRFKHYVLNETPCDITDVEFVVDEDAQQVMIQCPDWLRFDPTSVPPEEAPEVPVKTASLHDMRLNRQERRAVAKRLTQRLK